MNRLGQDDHLDSPLFGSEDEVEEIMSPPTCPWNVLVVDDDADVIAVTRLIFASFRFEDRPIRIIPATSGKQARTLLAQENQIAAAFVDVVMESDHAGLELVRHIRQDLRNDNIQLILRTGQPGYAPEIKVILEYGINDYRVKTDLDNVKLITSLVSALRNYQNICRAQESTRQQALMESISQAKSMFFAQMSHDFRTPLNSILGFCELLDTCTLDETQCEYVQLITHSGQYLLQLVNDILDFSKAEAGKIRLDLSEFSLADLARDVFKQLQPQVHENVSLVLSLSPDIPPLVRGDTFRLRQVLFNILSNALKFTRKGKVELAVSVVAVLPHAVKVTISIRDTGIGIAKENIAKLFSAYQQAENSVGREFGGTGLGLMICKQLVDLMGGDIAVNSELGKGTQLSVTLEFETPAPKSGKASPETHVITLNRDRVRFDGRRVLVVDDDPANRLLLSRILQSKGVQVTKAESGADALLSAGMHTFDLILTDCGLPDMDGFELTRQIRLLPQSSQIPIVALSGSDPKEFKKRIIDCGMNEFVQKPVRVSVVQGILGRWLQPALPPVP